MKYSRIPDELAFGVEQVHALLELDNVQSLNKMTITFEKADGMTLNANGNTITIGYDRITDALRALTFLERFVRNTTPISQKAKFETLCTMVDCSRNSVLNVDAAKNFMVHMAMMGFNSMMLYTEDTYEIPGHPYFGHLRGKYTVEEMKELDDFAAAMGLELIPCIQTLAHLNAITDWSCYKPYIDVSDILLADDERTYALIEAMLKVNKECFRTNRIHIGMDEAHLLGRGKHIDRFGYEKKSDIMVRHLAKVVELCKKHDYEPVMWSDMFFRMQFNGVYRIGEGELLPEVIEKIPEDIAMCYWEYYTTPNQIPQTDHMFHCHETMNREIWFAGGSWSWSGIAPKNRFSLWVTPDQLKLAEKHNVKHIIATCWGDDGGECNIFNMLPSLLQYAEYCYDNTDEATLNNRSCDCFGISFDDFLKIDSVGYYGPQEINDNHPNTFEKAALYNDPLIGVVNWDLEKAKLEGKYAKDIKILESVPENRYSYLFDTQLRLAILLDKKTYLSHEIKAAYRKNNLKKLQKIVDDTIPELLDLTDDFIDAFRFEWHWVNKPFGFEIQDLRLGGLKQRLVTASIRLQQYIDGEIERIEELEQPDLPLSCNEDKLSRHMNIWRRVTTRSVVGHH
ncbi:MAG: beta-N-acetylhexosaminidase [Clostridia bacterium]|nr:beta-N-acetylhexosaminidase [Clostridia bacterium]